MPVTTGIILSISIITALGIAIIENPQIQAWLEEQRQRIAELLRSIGEELDPQSRRAAEAFAFEGQTPATNPGLKREATGSEEAAAVATGRSLSTTSTIRRIPVKGPTDLDEAEERRRKGREYLAQRNLQMYELQQRRKAAKAEGAATPPTPTSFDAMVDDDGKLKPPESEKELPSPPADEPVPNDVKAEMREVERNLTQPLLAGESSASASGWSFGSQLANPFSDEYALDRSMTPKPPVPPKVALDEDESRMPTLPGSFTPRQTEPQQHVQAEEMTEELSYEEQLAIALSLSEAEAERSATAASSRQNQTEDDDADLRAAIEASLKDMNAKAATRAPELSEPSTPQAIPQDLQPLVDLTPPSPTLRPRQPAPRGHWEILFDQDYSPSHEPLSLAHTAPQPEEEDELYRVTPDLTRARLATLEDQQLISPPSTTSSIPYDPVREAASQSQQAVMEASFYSAASSAPSPVSTNTMDHEPTPQLIDVCEDVSPPETRTPTSRSSFGFQTDTDSDSDTFASMSDAASRAPSQPRSEISNIEVIDVEEDSDVDMLSEEGDGVATPDSWTEVGSGDGESEMDDDEQRQHAIL